MWQTLTEGAPWEGSLKNQRPDGTTWWAHELITPIYVGAQVVGYWANVREERTDPAPPTPIHPGKREGSTPPPFFESLEFGVVFQPLVDLRTESVLGYEALIRPRRHGVALSPLDLFSDAVAAGLDAELDGACLQAISINLAAMGTWPKGHKLFVNMRSSTLKDPTTFHRHLQSLAAVVPWGQLVVEVAEQGTTAVRDWEAWARLYPHVVFAQDDVGAGEADLLRLVRLRPTWVKLDMSLISRIADDEVTRQLVNLHFAPSHKA
jgi:EAL domain-containing protein (putative c-di-GMP-specific phosphodiesterase class I)